MDRSGPLNEKKSKMFFIVTEKEKSLFFIYFYNEIEILIFLYSLKTEVLAHLIKKIFFTFLQNLNSGALYEEI